MPSQRIRRDATPWTTLLYAHLYLIAKLVVYVFVDRAHLDRTTAEVVDSILDAYHDGPDILQARESGVGSVMGTELNLELDEGELLGHWAKAPRSPTALLLRMSVTWPTNEDHVPSTDRTEIVPTDRMKR